MTSLKQKLSVCDRRLHPIHRGVEPVPDWPRRYCAPQLHQLSGGSIGDQNKILIWRINRLPNPKSEQSLLTQGNSDTYDLSPTEPTERKSYYSLD
jgi:hypothetical protein